MKTEGHNQSKLPTTQRASFLLLERTDQRTSLYDPVRRAILYALNQGQTDYESEVNKTQKTLEDGTRITEETIVEKPVQRFWMTVPEIIDSIRSTVPDLALSSPICYYHLRKLQEQNLIEQYPPKADLEDGKGKRIRGMHFRTKAQFFIHATAEASAGYPIEQIMPPEVGKSLEKVATEVRTTGNTGALEYSIELEGVSLLFYVTMNLHDDGQSMVAVVRNISHQKTLEEQLKKSEIEFDRLIEDSFQGYAIFQDGSVVFANSAYATMVGRSTEDLLKMTATKILAMIHSEDRGVYRENSNKILAGLEKPLRHMFRYVRPDGSIRSVESFARKVEYQGKPAIQTLEIDITEQTKAELEQVAHQLVCLRNVTKLLSETKSPIQDVLNVFVHLIPEGWQYPDITCARVIFSEQEVCTTNFKETKWKQTADIITADGDIGVLEVFYLEQKPTMDEGPFLKHERSYIDTLATEIAHFIDQRKSDEIRQQLHTELEIYSRFLRHDLTNDLGVIIGNIDIARLISEPTDSTLQEVLTSIDAVCERMTSLLQTFGRPTGTIETEISVIVKRIADVAHKAHASLTVNIKTEKKAKGLRIRESRLLPLVFENLFRNATVHAGEQPKVDVTISKKDHYATIIVTDDGPGVSEKIRKNLFENGVSTKGGGLGLYLSKQVVEEMGGTIELIPSKSGKGATFKIRLPLTG